MQKQTCQTHITKFNQIHGLCAYSLLSSFFSDLTQNIRIFLRVNLFEEYLKNNFYILETSIIIPQNELKWKRDPL